MPSKVILFIEFLTMIVSGQSSPFTPLQLHHCYQQKWQSKTSDWICLDWKNQSISYITVCENIYKNTLLFLQIYQKNALLLHCQINHSPQKHRSSTINVWQESEFASVAGNNLRKSSFPDVWRGFEFAFVAINDFCRKIKLDVWQGSEHASAIYTTISIRHVGYMFAKLA